MFLWAGDKLREHGDIGCQIDEIPLRRDGSAVHIHGIAQNLERIEADADRQRQPQQRDRQPGQSVQVGDHEIGILEVSQRTEAQEDGQHKKQLRPFRAAEALNKTPKDIALQDGAEHNRQITRLTPAVKHKA